MKKFRYYYQPDGNLIKKITFSRATCPVIDAHAWIETEIDYDINKYSFDAITGTIKPKTPE